MVLVVFHPVTEEYNNKKKYININKTFYFKIKFFRYISKYLDAIEYLKKLVEFFLSDIEIYVLLSTLIVFSTY